MQTEKLAYMANQIAAFFQSQPHDKAVAGVADHINKFWEPRMRAQLLASIEAGNTSLKPIVLEAAPMIRKPKS
ncbi:MAG: formate dehydrogenase subunit delta [Rhodomicrobium sp.]|nr:formate dehydrogenase subunit delta [Rhodomicrobium sp.]